MLTVKEYIANGGERCPYCGTEDIQDEDTRHIGPKLVLAMICNLCDKTWEEIYQLIGYKQPG